MFNVFIDIPILIHKHVSPYLRHVHGLPLAASAGPPAPYNCNELDIKYLY